MLIRGAEVLAGLDTVLQRAEGHEGHPPALRGPRAKWPRPWAWTAPSPATICWPQAGSNCGLERHLRGILAGPRLGITFATPEDQARPWRFADADSRAVLQRKALGPL